MSINQTLTSGFIDLATYDELEKYLYGGSKATAYFVGYTRKSTWFTLVPTVLSKNMGQSYFGQEWAASISRAGDYLVHTWLRANIPAISLSADYIATNPNAVIRYTHNFGHNLIQEAAVTFNDLVAARFDSYYLDFWAAFTVPASKQVGYNNMIGNVNVLTNATASNLPAFTINVPLPFFFTRDSGVALPTAALPYNEMRIQFQFRALEQLVVVYPLGTGKGKAPQSGELVVYDTLNQKPTSAIPQLAYANVWAEYAIVSNDERKRMGCAPRDILIEQVQTAPRGQVRIAKDTQVQDSLDIRFSHAIKALLFSARNSSVSSEWSNYSLGNVMTTGVVGSSVDVDPLQNVSLLYESTQRLAALPVDYYSLVEPWFKAPTIPSAVGYHVYSYSLNFYDINPMGSTNYGKLTNVSLDWATIALAQLNLKPGQVETLLTNTYEFIVCAVNNNVIRISGGALGFPVL